MLKELGVKPIINAHGALTVLGGCVLANEILDAIKEASQVYVDVPELQLKTGQYIANLVGAEDAYVTGGGGAGLVLSVAACLTRGHKERMRILPRTEGFPNGLIIQKLHRNSYDYIAEITGARLVEIGRQSGIDENDLENSLDPGRICAVLYFAYDPQEGALPLDQVVKISHQRDIPVIVDAAAELPPKENLQNFLKIGADLVIFSGGKDLGAPNDTGLVLGRKELVGICRRLGPHSYETDESGTHVFLGRPMKTSKEDILAVAVAVRKYLETDHDARMKEWERMVEYIAKEISKNSSYKARKIAPGFGHPRPVTIPRVEVETAEKSLSASDIVQKLKSSIDQPIYTYSMGDRLYVNPQCLRPGEEKIIAERLIFLFH